MRNKRRTGIRSLAIAAAAVIGLPAVAMAAEQPSAPVKLADAELEQVSGGDGSLLNVPMNIDILLKNIAITVNVSNVPINAGVAAQVNALGSAEQTATVQALQSVTQIQTLGPLPAVMPIGGQ